LHPHVNIIITIQSTFSSNKPKSFVYGIWFSLFTRVFVGEMKKSEMDPFETCISTTIATIIIILDYMCLCFFLVCICISSSLREFSNHQCARCFASSFPFHTKGEVSTKEIIVPSQH
jgi:hypothetical protein